MTQAQTKRVRKRMAKDKRYSRKIKRTEIVFRGGDKKKGK